MGGFGSGRPRGSGGRQPGAKNVITEKVKGDLLAVYRQLGGRRWLLAYARAHEDEFCRHLMRRLPPPREDADEPAPVDTGSPGLMEAARRIAFVLAQADALSRPLDVELVGLSPPPAPEQQDPPPAPLPPLDEAPTMEPCALAGNESAGETPTSDTLETFRGNAAEQGRTHAKPDVIDQRRLAHEEYVSRLAAHHRRSLL